MSIETINKSEIAKSFGRAAHSYDSVAHFQRWVSDNLLDKVTQGSCQSVLDLGCGTGYSASSILEKFPGTQYIGLDLSSDMLAVASSKHDETSAIWTAGDAEAIPLVSNSVDLVFSSLAIQWCSDLRSMFAEVNRVLKPGGYFVFASLVDGTLQELKQAWAQVDDNQHVNTFGQLEDYENALAGLAYRETNLSVETRVLRYQRVKDLTRELKMLGAHNMTAQRSTKMMGKQKLKGFIEAYEALRLENGLLPASYEVLWGVLAK